MSTCDLHIHSSYSDGSLTPEELIELARAAGLSAVALCDHDTIAGLSRFEAAAARAKDIIPIPGVEVTTAFMGKEVHIVALFLDKDMQEKLNVYFEKRRESKKESVLLMTKRLAEDGYKISFSDVMAIAGKALPNRVHIANALMEKGYISSVGEAFNTILSRDGKYYIDASKPDALEAIRFLSSIGALPILAHPFLSLSYKELCYFLPLAKRCGLVALESIYPTFTKEESASAAKLADEFGLLQSGGSDFHGNNKPNTKIGTGINNNISVPFSIYERLKTAII